MRTDIDLLGELPTRYAAEKPNETALLYDGNAVSFAQLEQRSIQFANALRRSGIQPGSRIAFLDKNSEHFFYILFGAAKAGVALVTVNFRLTAPEVRYILNDAEAELVFCAAEFAPLACADDPELASLKQTLVIENGGSGLSHWFGDEPVTLTAEPGINPTDCAVQMYTSGTTGHPKGVELSHHAMVMAARDGLSVWPVMFRPGAAVLATMPLFHIAAANLCIAALYAGGRAEIVRDVPVPELAQMISTHRIAIVPLPAATVHAILALPNINTLDFGALDTLLIAGSGIAVDLLRRAQDVLKCGFALSYGMTECCGGLTYLGPDQCVPDAGRRLGSAGKAIGDNHIRILRQDGSEADVGEIGEIACQSERQMNGYWRRPEATAEVLRDGWYLSGDAGYLDEDGFLFVVDRIKDMVVSGGENIYPAEIEQALSDHPAIDQVSVIGVPDERWGEALLALIIPVAEKRLSADDYIDFLRPRLAGFKIPRRYAFVDDYPRNATGKILKRVLREHYGPV